MSLVKHAHLLTVDEVLERVTERDLARWSAFNKIEREEHEAEMAKVKR